MAVAFVRDHVDESVKVAGATDTYALTATVPAGSLLVAVSFFDNAAVASKPVISSISKMAGEANNWVFLGAARSTSTTAGAFASGEMWAIKTSVPWANATSLTFTYDTSITMKAQDILEFTGAEAALRSTVGTAYSTTTTAASATTTGTTPSIGDLAVGFTFGSNVAAAQAGDTDTTGGSWSTVKEIGSTGGNVATNNYGITQYKILTAASHQTYNNSAAMTAGNGSIVAILQATPDPAVTQAAYRWYAEGTESGATALAAQDTAVVGDIANGDATGTLRIRLQSTTAVAVQPYDDWQLQYEKNASGTWVNVVGPARAAGYDASNFSGVSAVMSTGGVPSLAQSFQGDGKRLIRAGAYLKQSGTPNGTVTMSLWAHSGTFGSTGVPTGSPLATSTTVIDSTSLVVAVDPIMVYFEFSGAVTLAAGTPYFIGVTTTNTVSSAVAWGQDSSTPTDPGNKASFAGASWSAASTEDLIFEVYTQPAGASTALTYDSPNLTNGEVTTNRLTGGTGSFVAGKVSEDALMDDLGWTGSNYTELVYALKIKAADVVSGDTLRFRVLRNGATTGLTYAQTPTISITQSLPAVTQAAYRFYADGTESGLADGYDETNFSGNLLLNTISDVGQSFLGNGGRLSRARFWLSKNGAPSGNVTARLFAHTGTFGSGTGTGSPLATSTSRLRSSLQTTAQWEYFDFDGTFTLAAGTPYVISVTQDDNSLGMMYGNDSSPTHAGGASTRTSGGVWSIFSSDVLFGVYTDNALAAQDTAYTADLTAGDVNLQLRTRLQSTTAAALPGTDDWGLQCEKNASGLWSSINLGTLALADTYPVANKSGTNPLSSAAPGFAQSFLGDGKFLGRAGFDLSKTGTPNGTVTAVLYAHSGAYGDVSGIPTGAALATSTTTLATTSISTTAGWVYFDFDGYLLTSGTPYFIAIVTTNSLTPGNHVGVGLDTSSPTHAGHMATYNGTTWSGNPADLIFEVYTFPTPVSVYVSPNLTEGAATTNRLGAGTGSFVAGKVALLGTANNLGWSGNNYTEVLYSLTLKPSAVVDSLVDGYPETNTSGGMGLTAGDAYGQTFLGNGTPLSKAGFRMSKFGSPTGNMTAYLYAHTGTFGTGKPGDGAAPLATSAPISAATLTTTATWTDFTFDGSFTLANGTAYCVMVVSGAGDGSNAVLIDIDTDAPTNAGNAVSTNDGGSTWFTDPSFDTIFRVYTSTTVTTLANSDTLRFRVLRNGATTSMTYTQVPTIPVTITAGLTRVSASRATTWDVAATAAQVTASRSSTWHVTAAASASRSTTWHALAAATPTRTTTWDVTTPVVLTRTTTWDVTTVVTRTRATTWNARIGISASKATTWDIAGVAASPTGFIHHVAIATPRNGTFDHNGVSPSSGTVVAGSTFTPTTGSLLVCVGQGSVTATTPSGWSLPANASAINNAAVYAWTKTATGTDSIDTTHNASNFPFIFDFYEFPAGSTFVASVAAVNVDWNGGAGPVLSGLTGTNWTAGAFSQDNFFDADFPVTWNAGIEATDTTERAPAGSTDGYVYSLTYINGDTASSRSYAATNGLTAVNAERLVFAVNVAAAAGGPAGAWIDIPLPFAVPLSAGTAYVASVSTDGYDYGSRPTAPASASANLTGPVGYFAAGTDVFPGTPSGTVYYPIDVTYHQGSPRGVTSWNVFTQVSLSRSSTWDVAPGFVQVSLSRATTWTVETPVTVTRVATWHALAPTTASRATLWDVARLITSVSAARPTTWDVARQVTQVTASKSSTWHVRSASTATRASTWHTLAPLAATARTTTWHTQAPLTATRATTWHATAAIAITRSSTWRAEQAVALTRAATWDVLLPVVRTRTTTWNADQAVVLTRATTWDILTPVLRTRATTWNADQTVVLTRAATWDVLLPVLRTRTTTWNAEQAVLLTRATTWRVRAPVSAARSTTWQTPASVSATRATTWHAKAAVTGSRSTLWDVARLVTSVSASRTTTWDVARQVTQLTASRATTWHASAPLTATRPSTWHVLAPTAATRPTTWHVRSLQSATRATTWHAPAALTATRATTWATGAGLSGTRAVTWHILGPVPLTRGVLWNVLTPAAATKATTWHTRASQSATRSTTWNVVGPLGTFRSTTWHAGAATTAIRVTTWHVGASASASRATTWHAKAAASTTKTTLWDVARLTTQVTVSRPTTWDVARQITSVSASRPTTWQVLSPASASRGVLWTVLTPATGTRATTWRTWQSAATTRATTWHAAAAVPVTRTVTWRVLTPTSLTRATTWTADVGVSITRSSTWDVAAQISQITAARATTWNLGGRFTVARVGLWSVLTPASATRATTWAVLSARAATRATTWHTQAPVTASKATTWHAKEAASQTRASTWTVLSARTAATPTTWTVLSARTATKATSWNVVGPLATFRATTWHIGGRTSLTRDTTWHAKAASSRTVPTTWAVLSARTTSKATTWHTLAPQSATRASTWHTKAAVTALTSTTWNLSTALPVSRATTWATTALVAETKAALWQTSAGLTTLRSTTWGIIGRTSTGRSTTWHVRAGGYAVVDFHDHPLQIWHDGDRYPVQTFENVH